MTVQGVAESVCAGDVSAASVERAAKRKRSVSEANDDNRENCNCNAGALAIIAKGPSAAAPPPGLATMSPKLVTHTLRFLVGGHDALATFLALDKTCKSLHGTMLQDEVWRGVYPLFQCEYEHPTTVREGLFIMKALRGIRTRQRHSDEDIILSSLGGAGGVRKVVGEIMYRMRPDVGIIGKEEPQLQAVLRGDAVAYLTGVVQEHLTDRLGKAHQIVINKLRPGDPYPSILPADLQFLDELIYQEYCSVAKGSHGKCIAIMEGWAWPADDCEGDEVLGSVARRTMVRALAYRAGVVKMSGEAFSLVAAETLHCMGSIAAHAFEACKGMYEGNVSKDSRYVTPKDVKEDEKGGVGYGNYVARYCPPFEEGEDGQVKCIIVPRQIEDAAVKMGMKPLLGFDHNFAFWAASSDEKREEEVEEAKAQYFKDSDAMVWEAESDQVAGRKNPSLLQLARQIDGQVDRAVVVSPKLEEMEEAASSGNYIKAGFLQAEEKMSATFDAAIVYLQTQMGAAAAKENYVEAGRKQQIVQRLERSQESLGAVRERMFAAAVQQDFVLAGRLQEQYNTLLKGQTHPSKPVTVAVPTMAPLSTQ